MGKLLSVLFVGWLLVGCNTERVTTITVTKLGDTTRTTVSTFDPGTKTTEVKETCITKGEIHDC